MNQNVSDKRVTTGSVFKELSNHLAKGLKTCKYFGVT